MAYDGICCFCRARIPDYLQDSCTADHLVCHGLGAPCRAPFIQLLCKPCDAFKGVCEEIYKWGPPLSLEEIGEGKERGWPEDLEADLSLARAPNAQLSDFSLLVV